MAEASYKQFCPVAMAAEILCTRWTMVLLRELIAGSTRFNDIQRGVPKMSRSLLSRRLKELEAAGVVDRTALNAEQGIHEYTLTPAGKDLFPVIESMGIWGQKWVESQLSLKNLDPSLLMWDMRRNLDASPLPAKRTVVQFCYPELPSTKRDWWMIVGASGEVDLCWSDPGFDVDLFVTTDLRTMTAIWMGLTTVQRSAGLIAFDGDRGIAETMQQWLGLSPFASVPRMAS